MYWDKPFFTVVTMSNTDWIQPPPVCGAEHGWQHFRLENAAFNLNVSFADAIKNFSFHTVRGVRAMNTDTPPEKLSQLIAQLNARGSNDYRRYDAVRTFLNFKARDKGIPLSGTFELTPLCNLDCKMCYVHLNQAQIQGAQCLSAEQWKQLMQQAIDAGMMYARLTGGECLTYPGFRELYLFLRNQGVETVILTNGLLLDADMVDFLQNNPPAAIQVSLYGAGEDTYEQVTGRRAFSLVMDNIRRVKAADLPLTVAVTPSAYMTDAEQILHVLDKEKLPFAINASILPPRPETGRELADASLDTYIAVLKLRSQLKGRELLLEEEPESLPDPGGKQKDPVLGVTCGAGRSGFAIDWQGYMRPCNNFPCKGENALSLGFHEAWKRTNHTATHYPLPVECDGCAYHGICMHCVAAHAAGANPGHASPAVCAMGRRIVTEGLCSLDHK